MAFSVVGIPLSIWWLVRIIERLNQKVKYAYWLLTLGIVVLFFNLFVSEDLLGELDWKYYYTGMKVVFG